MKINFFSVFFLIISITINAQEDGTTYITINQEKEKRPVSPVFSQLEINTSLIGNTEEDDPYTSYDESRPWFIPNGIGVKYGVGVHKNRWVSLSMHSGIDWKANERLIAIPIYGNLRLSPKIGPDTRLVLQTGLGRGYAIGRGNMQGRYEKYTLGLESDENNLGLFVEVSGYSFGLHRNEVTALFNIGFYIHNF